MGRQVIDIRKDGEKVYVKNHAKVTFLSDGTNVEQRIIDVSNDLSTKVNKDYIDDILENIIIDSSQIDFNQLQNNPFVDNNSGKLEVTDESGNIIAKIDAEGIHSVDFIAGEHRLSDKTDKTYVDEAIKNVEVDLTGYATEEYVNNIDFYNIKDNPIVNNGDGKLLFVDENGYIGLQLEEDGLYVKDVIADGHTLSQKADKSDIPSLDGYATESYVNTNLQNYATKDEVSDLVDMSVVTELQGKVDKLIDADADKSVRDIAVDVLTETLVSETATEAYDTLAEMSDWIKSHPEDAAAMNTAIQKNAEDITNLDAAYKAADTKVLTDAQEYTDNINFYTIKDNPIVDGEAGSITFVDETGYIGLKVTEDGIIAKDVVTPEHTLSSKADKIFVEDNYYNKSTVDKKIAEAVTGGQVSLDGFATEQWVNEQGFIKEHQDISHLAEKSDLPNFDEFAKSEDIPSLDGYAKTSDIPSLDDYASKEWVNNKNYATEYELSNIDYNSIKNAPLSEDETGELNIADESGNIGMKVASEAVYAKDFVAGEHKLSEKVDKTYVDNSIAELVDGAPETLDTLNELAAALHDNADIVGVLNQSISNKQDKLVSGTNIKTINGISILGSGDITIESGAKVYELDLTGRGNYEGYITEEEWNIIKTSDRIKIITDVFSTEIVQIYSPFFELYGGIAFFSSTTGVQGGLVTQCMFTGANTTEGSPYSYIISEVSIPTKTSQLENNSNFITSDGLKTINGQSLIGEGDITISGGGSSSGKEYVEAPLMTEPIGTSIMFTNSVPFEPNKVYVAKEKVYLINARMISIPRDSIGAEYTIMFQTSTSELPILVDTNIPFLWANGAIPTIEADTYYELSLVLNNIDNTRIFKAVLTPFKPVE